MFEKKNKEKIYLLEIYFLFYFHFISFFGKMYQISSSNKKVYANNLSGKLKTNFSQKEIYQY